MNMNEYINKIIDEKLKPQTFIGKAVNVQKETCDVEREGLPTIKDVRLQSVINGDETGFIIHPKKDSWVIGQFIENSVTGAFITSVTEFDKLTLSLADSNVGFQVTKKGIAIERDSESLLKILDEFIGEVAKIIVVQGTSPNVAKLTELKTRLGKVLKDGIE